MRLALILNQAPRINFLFDALIDISPSEAIVISDTNVALNRLRKRPTATYSFENASAIQYSNRGAQNISIDRRFLFCDQERFAIYGLGARRPPDWYGVTQNLIHFYRDVFDKEKPDFVISEPVANVFLYAAWLVCKEAGIPYIGLQQARINNRLFITDHPFHNPQGIRVLSEHELPAPLGLVQNEKPTYVIDQKTNYDYFFWKIRYFCELLYSGLRGDVIDIYKTSISKYFLKLLIWRLRRKVNSMRLRYSYRFDKLIGGNRYFVFPLHFRPEASTSILSPFYNNELEIIKNISMSLPEDVMLVVKEHPAAFGIRDVSFFDSVRLFGNVLVLGPEENVGRLIEGSSGVITISSTMGFEALQKGKPVAVFGNVFYSNYGNCTQLRSYHEIRDFIKKALSTSSSLDAESREIVSYYSATVEGNIVSFEGEQYYDAAKNIISALRVIGR